MVLDTNWLYRVNAETIKNGETMSYFYLFWEGDNDSMA
ncbi:hypothetical protein PRUB_b0185 [Pseudoalteromonas rubra]|uniref:Uncharacterized protein n=1 Tax=Pseudoalteromonas rubra TaxID=43658 RepID=A0A8T0BZ20_9GAMM|nr:hypothetical protein PRUB_b0185 [Pseudoalteromonas rubra]